MTLVIPYDSYPPSRLTTYIKTVVNISLDNPWIIGPKLRHNLISRILNDAFFASARQIEKLSTENKTNYI